MRRPYIGPLAVIVLVSAIALFTSSDDMSPTVDETHYAGLGRYLAERGDWSYRSAALHPPLSYYMNSLLLGGLDIPEQVWNAPSQDERGRRLFRIGPGERVVTLTRIPNRILFLILVVMVFLEGRRLFGDGAALAAALFTAVEPNLLAHAGVATPDLPLTAMFFWAVMRFLRHRREGGATHLVLAGVALGLALLSKYTSVLLIGILPLLALAAERGDRRRFARLFRSFALIVVVALAVLYAGYLPLWVHHDGADRPPAIRAALPAPYVDGIAYQLKANEGHRAFFFGRVSDGGWTLYYPAALLVKTPIPLLLLSVTGLWMLAAVPARRRDAFLIALPPAALLLFFVVAGRIQIGVRYLLPAYPFLALAAGYAVAKLLGTGAMRRAAGVVLTGWMVGGTAAAWPHFIPYFNEAAGGAEGGVRILGDSNLDWGQDLPGLKRWLEEKGYGGVYLAYFGNADPSRYGIRFRYLPGWLYKPMEAVRAGASYHPEPELLAISRSTYQGFWLPDEKLYRWVDDYPRVASIGHSIDVYDIGADPSVHDKLALIYKRAGMEDYMKGELIRGMDEERKAALKRKGGK